MDIQLVIWSKTLTPTGDNNYKLVSQSPSVLKMRLAPITDGVQSPIIDQNVFNRFGHFENLISKNASSANKVKKITISCRLKIFDQPSPWLLLVSIALLLCFRWALQFCRLSVATDYRHSAALFWLICTLLYFVLILPLRYRFYQPKYFLKLS